MADAAAEKKEDAESPTEVKNEVARMKKEDAKSKKEEWRVEMAKGSEVEPDGGQQEGGRKRRRVGVAACKVKLAGRKLQVASCRSQVAGGKLQAASESCETPKKVAGRKTRAAPDTRKKVAAKGGRGRLQAPPTSCATPRTAAGRKKRDAPDMGERPESQPRRRMRCKTAPIQPGHVAQESRNSEEPGNEESWGEESVVWHAEPEVMYEAKGNELREEDGHEAAVKEHT